MANYEYILNNLFNELDNAAAIYGNKGVSEFFDKYKDKINVDDYERLDNYAKDNGYFNIQEKNNLFEMPKVEDVPITGDSNENIEKDSANDVEALRNEKKDIRKKQDTETKIDREDQERFETIGLTNKDITFDRQTIKNTLATINNRKEYKEDDKRALIKDISTLEDVVSEAKKMVVDYEDLVRENLCEETKKLLVDYDDLFHRVFVSLGSINGIIQKIEDNVEWHAKEIGKSDATGGGSRAGSYGGVGVGSATTVVDGTSSIEETEVEEINPEITTERQNLMNLSIGTVTFTEIVTMFEETIGGNQVQSSPEASYNLIGVLENEGTYYYKIIDKETGKIYYIEISDKVNVQSEINEVANIKEATMILNSTNIGEDIFVKTADANSLYLVQNKVENDGINYANIIDSTDGNDYYIPISDSVEIISLDSLKGSLDEGNK